MAAPKLTKRTLAIRAFKYMKPSGGWAIAHAGETVALLPDDLKRGERLSAFTAELGEPPAPAKETVLLPFPRDGSEAEHDAWVLAATDAEVIDAVTAEPAIAQAVVDAELRRGDNAPAAVLDAVRELIPAPSDSSGGSDSNPQAGAS